MTAPGMALARAAYNAFLLNIAARHADAEPVFDWEHLTAADQNAWAAVADACERALADRYRMSVDVKGPMGERSLRFLPQPGGAWLTINQAWGSGPPFNGYLLMDWRGVLRELIAKTVPASLMNERGLIAEGQAGGQYHSVPLSYPLSAKALAGLLGADEADVRAELADLVVEQYR